MRKFIFVFLVSVATILLFLPDPFTTVLGIGLLSWTLIHFLDIQGRIAGACRCDACRLGITKASHSYHMVTMSPARASLFSYGMCKSEKLRRAQATLPLIMGRGLTPSYLGSRRWLKGEVVAM